MEFNKKNIATIVVIILLIIIFFLILSQPQQITQKINYSTFSLEKTINYGFDRAEIYESDIFDPIIIFLIAPKELTQSASNIKIEGDYQLTILKEDPVLMFEQTDLTPGKKSLKIIFPDKNKELTTIAFAIPYSNYSNLSEIEKEQLKSIVLLASENSSENFTIENSLKVMQNFANSQTQAGFQIKTDEKKIFLSEEDSKRKIYLQENQLLENLANAFLKKNNEPQMIIQKVTPTPTQFENDFLEAFEKSINKSFIGNEETVSDYVQGIQLMKVNFKEKENDLFVPEEIVLPYSKENNTVIWNAIIQIEEEEEISPDIELIFSGPENIDFKYLKIQELIEEMENNQNEIDSNNETSYGEIREEKGKYIFCSDPKKYYTTTLENETENTKTTASLEEESMLQSEEINDEEIMNLEIDKNDEPKCVEYQKNPLSPIYLIQLTIDTENYQEQTITESISLRHNSFLSKQKEMKISLIRNDCSFEYNHYFKPKNSQEVKNQKTEILLSAVSCQAFMLGNTTFDRNDLLDNNIYYAQTINENIVFESIKNDPNSYSKIIEEKNKMYKESFNKYLNINEKLIKKLENYRNEIQKIIHKLNILSEVGDEKVKEESEKIIIQAKLEIANSYLVQDPTKEEYYENAINTQLEQLENLGIEKTPDLNNSIKEIYRNIYGWSTVQKVNIGSKMNLNIEGLEKNMTELEINFAKILMNFGNSKCPVLFKDIYDEEDPRYNIRQNVVYRNIVKTLLLREINYADFESEKILGEDTSKNSNFGKMLDEYEKLTRLGDGWGCEFNINEFEEPRASDSVWGVTKEIFGTLPIFTSPGEKREQHNKVRESLRLQAKETLKEIAGTKLVYQKIFPELNSGRYDGNYKNNGKSYFDSNYINFSDKNKISLIELFNHHQDKNMIANWMGIETNNQAVEFAIENMTLAFQNILSNDIETIKHLKFNPVITDYSKAEQLQSELVLVNTAINAEQLIIAKEILKEEESTMNYILYDTIMGSKKDKSTLRVNYDSLEGLKKIKELLIVGKNFSEIKEDNNSQNQTTTTPSTTTQDWRILNSTQANTQQNTYVDYSQNYNSVSTANTTTVVSTDTTKGNYFNDSKINSALKNPIIAAELEKIQLLESKEGKELTDKEIGLISLKIAQYYYDKSLFDLATEEYLALAAFNKDPEIQKKAKSQLDYLGKNGNLKWLFGKRYWQNFGKVTREFVSIKSLATMALFYGMVKATTNSLGFTTDKLTIKAAEQGKQTSRMILQNYFSGPTAKNLTKVSLDIQNGQLVQQIVLVEKIPYPKTLQKVFDVFKKIGNNSVVKSTWNQLVKERTLFGTSTKQQLESAFYYGLQKEALINFKHIERVSAAGKVGNLSQINAAKKSLEVLYSKGIINEGLFIKELSRLEASAAQFTLPGSSSTTLTTITEPIKIPTTYSLSPTTIAYNQSQLVPVSAIQNQTFVGEFVGNRASLASSVVNVSSLSKISPRVITADNSAYTQEIIRTQLESETAFLGSEALLYGTSIPEIANQAQITSATKNLIDSEPITLGLSCSRCGFKVLRTKQNPDGSLYTAEKNLDVEVYDDGPSGGFVALKEIDRGITIQNPTINGYQASVEIIKTIIPSRITAVFIPSEVANGTISVIALLPKEVPINIIGAKSVSFKVEPSEVSALPQSGETISLSPENPIVLEPQEYVCDRVGCSVSSQANGVKHNPTQKPLVQQPSGLIEVKNFEQIKSVDISLKQVHIDIPTLMSVGDSSVKVTAGNLATGKINITRSYAEEVTIREPTSSELIDLKDLPRSKDGRTLITPVGKMRVGEAKVNFQNPQSLEIVTDNPNVEWVVNGRSYKLNPASNAPKIDLEPKGEIMIYETDDFFNSGTNYVYFDTKISQGLPLDVDQVTYTSPTGNDPKIILSNDGKTLRIYSGSRDIRNVAKIQRYNGEIVEIQNIPTDDLGNPLVREPVGGQTIEFGDKLIIGDNMFIPTLNKYSGELKISKFRKPTGTTVGNINFGAQSVYLGRTIDAGGNPPNVLIDNERMPLLRIKSTDLETLTIRSGSNFGSQRAEAKILRSNGKVEVLPNGTTEAITFTPQDHIEILGNVFRAVPTSTGINIQNVTEEFTTKLVSKNLNFTCNSICLVNGGEGVEVIKFGDEASMTIMKPDPSIGTINITGDFSKKFVELIESPVFYSVEKVGAEGLKAIVSDTVALPNLDPNGTAMSTLQTKLTEGQIVALVSKTGTKQKITLYIPEELKSVKTKITDELTGATQIAPIIYDTTNPNYSVLTHAEENIGWIEARKTKPLVAVELTQDATIETLEGTLQAKQGQMLCYGVAGEPWPQDKAALLKKYDVLSSDSPLLTEEQKNILAQNPNAVAYSPKPDRSVMVAQLDTDAQVQASWGVLNAKKGDYLVKPAEDALSTNPQDVWVVDKTLFERTYNIVGEANIPSTQNQIEVFTLGNERSGVVGTTKLSDGEYLIIGNGSGDFRISANPLENTAATSEVVISQNNLLILSGNKLKISNENGKLFLEDIGSVEIAVESNGVFVPIQKNTPIEITPSTRIKATHKFVNQEFIFSLNNMPEYHYFSNKDYAGVDSKIYSVEKKND